MKERLTFDLLPKAISEILEKIENIEIAIASNNQEKPPIIDPEPYIYGITGLAKFLKVSLPTAQKLKNSNKIPFIQSERVIMFKKEDIFKALSNSK